MRKNIILGELGGYVANRAIENGEYRLDTPEPEDVSTERTSRSQTLPGLTGLGHWVQAGYQNLFNSNSRKGIEGGKTQS